ncbi:MAG: ATP-binding protein [Desulfatitalea sp.]|nr:ATP-binding protein [Desulfatitalea sp.]
MHEILIISGKGGTGKTSLAAAFAHLSQNAILCDLDVDAPDLHLILQPADSERIPFVSGFEARVRPQACNRCGVCGEMCRFQAIRSDDEGLASVDPIRCEGCGVCVHFCPEQAIDFTPRECGWWRIADTRFGALVHAQLHPGEENSGKLVALLRTEAKKLATAKGARLILSDGPPGIGCPVISAVSGTDLAVLVTEPTPSGFHDLGRVVELCAHFRVPAAVIINKWDLNKKVSGDIQAYCADNGLPVLAELPHDTDFVHAMVQGLAITEFAESEAARQVRRAWEMVVQQAAARRAA